MTGDIMSVPPSYWACNATNLAGILVACFSVVGFRAAWTQKPALAKFYTVCFPLGFSLEVVETVVAYRAGLPFSAPVSLVRPNGGADCLWAERLYLSTSQCWSIIF